MDGWGQRFCSCIGSQEGWAHHTDSASTRGAVEFEHIHYIVPLLSSSLLSMNVYPTNNGVCDSKYPSLVLVRYYSTAVA